jgi:hypothetical protein
MLWALQTFKKELLFLLGIEPQNLVTRLTELPWLLGENNVLEAVTK